VTERPSAPGFLARYQLPHNPLHTENPSETLFGNRWKAIFITNLWPKFTKFTEERQYAKVQSLLLGPA